jgi:hypothetical protein
VGELIQFPTSRVLYPERIYQQEVENVIEDNEENIKALHIMHVDETVGEILPILFRYLTSGGFDLSNTNNVKEGAFIVEALRSALLHTYNINHPFQKLTEEIFETMDDDILKIVTTLNIELEPEEDPEGVIVLEG